MVGGKGAESCGEIAVAPVWSRPPTDSCRIVVYFQTIPCISIPCPPIRTINRGRSKESGWTRPLPSPSSSPFLCCFLTCILRPRINLSSYRTNGRESNEITGQPGPTIQQSLGNIFRGGQASATHRGTRAHTQVQSHTQAHTDR